MRLCMFYKVVSTRYASTKLSLIDVPGKMGTKLLFRTFGKLYVRVTIEGAVESRKYGILHGGHNEIRDTLKSSTVSSVLTSL